MGRQTGRIIFAVFLILIGGALLLANLNLLPWMVHAEQPLMALLFGLGSLAFLSAFIASPRASWWAVIPACVLAGIALLIGFPLFWNEAGGAMFLGMIGLAFWAAYLTAPRERWWAVIPAGAMTTFAVITMISPSTDDGMLISAVFFLGIGLTFGLVYLAARQRWAIWPAGVLVLMGSLFLVGQTGLASLVFPILLVGFGGLLVLRSVIWRRQ